MTDRRHFLALMSGLMLSGCMAERDREAPVAPAAGAAGKRVLVIGAGMAGAKAAHDLREAGFSVLVLEARERIGGRIWTDRSLGAPLDLGAAWIHGAHGNPLTALARENGVPLHAWSYDSIDYFVGETGRLMDFYSAAADMESVLARAASRLGPQAQDASLRDALDQARAQGAFDGVGEADFGLARQIMVEQSFAAPVEALSLRGWMAGEAYGGPDYLFPQGYEALVAALLDGAEIRAGEPVSRIEYGPAGVAALTDGNRHEADFLVMTASLGVLQSGAITFDPPLPAAQRAAVQGLGMGVLNKLALRFPERFWTENRLMALRASDAEARWPSWFNLTGMTGEPLLVGLNGGSVGRGLEALDDDAILDEAMAALRGMYGAAVPDPTGHAITRWGEDRFALGSYSHVPPGVPVSARNAFDQMLDGTLAIAGEAWSADHPSTVHGAYLSGLAAARRIRERV